jgi:hypothetical protein
MKQRMKSRFNFELRATKGSALDGALIFAIRWNHSINIPLRLGEFAPRGVVTDEGKHARCQIQARIARLPMSGVGRAEEPGNRPTDKPAFSIEDYRIFLNERPDQ